MQCSIHTYASETFPMNRKLDLEEIMKAGGEIIRKILELQHTHDGYRLQTMVTTENILKIGNRH